ncbi:MAG TPA: class III extradiol dioxygenase subunit B-like domain-containing protein [Blastocatellia bacterium]|nr:class III extradiol dioxygenase subunit B-like domain-containing protein [Blastocatellia bacterium]
MAGSIVFAGIAPHPPLLVPEVGRDRIDRVADSRRALREFSNRLVDSAPDTVIVISPHSPLDPRAFTARSSPEIEGSFEGFSAPQVKLSFENDLAILEEIAKAAGAKDLPFRLLEREYDLDHGALVPLYYLHEAGWSGPVSVIGFTNLSVGDHVAFGGAIKDAALASDRRVAVVASGDLSHRLIVGGPYEFEPTAHLFDEQVVRAISGGNPDSIAMINPELRQRAGECGYRSILIALGCVEHEATGPRVLSYEGPFGVGYMVAVLSEARGESPL